MRGQNKMGVWIFLLNLINGGCQNKWGIGISKNQLISVMNEKRDTNV